MKLMQKTRFSLALATALGSAAILSSGQLMSAPQHPGDAMGGLDAAATTTTPYVAQNDLGQALVFPYYTVRDNQRTAINIMNTSGDTLAVKMTFREGKNSRDVLNFYILLSPYDVWSGYLSMSSGQTLLHRSTDEDSCVVGAFGKTENNVFTAMANQTEALRTDALVPGGTADDLNEGYITAVVAGKVDTAYKTVDPNTNFLIPKGKQLADAIKHNHTTGMPADCQAATKPFTVAVGPTSDVSGGTNVRGNPELDHYFLGLTSGENPLKGNLSILDADDGLAGGTAATAIANFNQAPSVTNPMLAPPAVSTADTNEDLVTAQNFPYFYNPSLASGDGLCTSTGIEKVENAMRANSIINEWSNNPVTSAGTDWVVTFPTKGFRVDSSSTNPYSVGFCNGTAIAPFQARYGNTIGGKIHFTMAPVDREEKEPINSPFPSPGPRVTPYFPNEVNVVTFADAGSSTKSKLGSKLAENLNFDLNADISGTKNGWADITFLNSSLASRGDATTKDLAALGFMWKVRKQPGSANTNFGQIIDHSTIAVSP